MSEDRKNIKIDGIYKPKNKIYCSKEDKKIFKAIGYHNKIIKAIKLNNNFKTMKPHERKVILESIQNRAVECDTEEFIKHLKEDYIFVEDDINEIINNSKEDIKLDVGFNIFTDMLGMADQFLEIQPLYFDRNKLWFKWNFQSFAWEMIDEIDILNAFDRQVNNPMITINSKTKNEILEALRRRARLKEPKEPEKTWVQFHDTIVDIPTGNKFKATPDYFFNCPVPHMISDCDKTPTMDKLFNEWVEGGNQNKSFVDTLYEVLAYSTLRHQFLQRLFAFTGTGSNGKGCFLQIVYNFLGKENISETEMKMLAKNNFEAASLYKKQAAVMGEVDVDDLSNTNLLKKLTGQDRIRYEFKGKDPFSEESFCTCFVATNSLPMTPDKSDGFYRRWLLIEFPNQFPTGKDVIAEIPQEEYQNLACKCVKIARGLYQKRAFTNEGSILDRKKTYEARSNPIASFIEKYCEDSPNDDIMFSEFYNIFLKYLDEQRLREITKRKVSMILRKEGYIVKTKHYLNEKGEDSTAYFIFSLRFNAPIPTDTKDTQSQVRTTYRNEQQTQYLQYRMVSDEPNNVEKGILQGQFCHYCGTKGCSTWDSKGNQICSYCETNPQIKQ